MTAAHPAELSAAQRAAKKSAIEFYNDCAIVRIDAVTEYLQDFLATGVKCPVCGGGGGALGARRQPAANVALAPTAVSEKMME